MTIWNHKAHGRIEGEIVRISEGGAWTYIRLTAPATIAGFPTPAGALREFRTCNLDEDRTGHPAPTLSPDCRDGNHQKCDGVAWDLLRDEPTDCGCDHHA